MVTDSDGSHDKANTQQGSVSLAEKAPVDIEKQIDAPAHRYENDDQAAIANKTLVDRINRSDRWMIGLTAVIAVGGAVSAVIFGMQLSAMRGQLEEMRRAYEPVREQAEASKKQTTAFLNSEQPKLVIEDFAIFKLPPAKTDPTNTERDRIFDRRFPYVLIIGVTPHNIGKTTTTISKYGIGWKIDSRLSPVPIYRHKDGPIVLEPISNPERAHKWMYFKEWPIAVSKEQQADIASGKASLWVFGYFCYSDLIGPVSFRFGGKWIGTKTQIDSGFSSTDMPIDYATPHPEDCT